MNQVSKKGAPMRRYSMSKKELRQAELFVRVKNGDIGLKKAIELSPVGERQTRRNYKKFMENNAEGLVHKNCGKTSNRAICPEVKKIALELLASHYVGYSIKLSTEMLGKHHNIKMSHSTLRRILIENKLHVPRKKRSIQRQWRDPKEHKGELVQLDGSYHKWFEGDDHYYTVIAFIDDATREVFLRFSDESTEGVATTFKEYIEQNGIPLKLYTDRGKVFKVNKGSNEYAETQFKRMCSELDCDIIFAYSPQAKGRVERLFRTLQDRLVKELKRQNITTIEEANKMLKNYYIAEHNKKFNVKPKNSHDIHRDAKNYNLDTIFCCKEQRKVNNDATISFKNKWYQLLKQQNMQLKSRDSIDVYVNFDGTISLWRNGIRLNFKPIEKPVKQPLVEDEYKFRRTVPRKVPANHPWRTFHRPNEKKLTDISIEQKL